MIVMMMFSVDNFSLTCSMRFVSMKDAFIYTKSMVNREVDIGFAK